jgi:hypothetical protein
MVPESTACKQGSQPWHVLVGQRDIEVVLNHGLSPQQCVYGPTAVNMDLYNGPLQESNQVCGGTRIH